ncbi:MAG TPA: nitrilase-related carbon-nitrogen hydrolase [Pirellulales bacterium]|nr:nitrilase-related carbon-nitrogen hydrolase [Pirellulales bacterium]
MRVTCVQLGGAWDSKDAALAEALACLDAARGSDLVLLPELWPSGYFSSERWAADAESADGPLVAALAAKAREIGVYLFTGSLVERDGSRLFNTSLLLDRDGRTVSRYRKMHLFGHQSQERRLLTAGEETVVVPTPWGLAGLSICYDLRFPELYRRMIDAGAELLLVAAAWPAARREAWTLLSRARAAENQAFVFACNAAGANKGVAIAGHSLVVDPVGKVVAEAGEAPCLLSVDVDPAMAGRWRREFPALDDRVLR